MLSVKCALSLQAYVYLCLVLLVLLILRSLYRITFHPLAGFPGPWLTAVTRCYEAYWDLCIGDGGQFTAEIRNMHARYGRIVRINPHEISVDDPEFHETLYAPQPAVRDKIPMIANILGTTAGTFGTLDHYHHRKRKAASSLFFSNRNVAKVDVLIRDHVDRFCRLLYESPSRVWEMRVQFMALKLDIFFDWAFGDELGLQGDADAAYGWDETMEAIATCAPFVKLMPWILPLAVRLPVRLVLAISPPLARVLRINHRIYAQACSYAKNPATFSHEKSNHAGRPVTLFQNLLESSLPAPEKTVWRISQEGSEMFAASGTTSRVMTTATFYLLNDPTTLDRLQAELDINVPNKDDLPPVRVLESLPYMAAVIKESLRMSAPVATRLPLVAREPIFYKQWKIPPGTPISVNTRDLSHNPSIFEDPNTFKPERWLEEDSSVRLDRYFVPFNKGTRMCMGKEFAMSELQITVAALFRRFDLELVDTHFERDVRVTRDCFLSEPPTGTRGVKVRVRGLRE